MSISGTDLVNQVVQATGLKKVDAEKAVHAVFYAIGTGLQQRTEVRINGFGIFRVAHRAASNGHNPRTGEKIRVAPRDLAKFVPAKALKDVLNPPPSVPRRKSA